MTAVPFEELSKRRDAKPSAAVRSRIERARDVQLARFGKQEGLFTNGQMTPRLVRTHCKLDDDGRTLMKMAISKLGLSARAYDRIL